MKAVEREQIIKLLGKYFRKNRDLYGKEVAKQKTIALLEAGITKKLLKMDLESIKVEELEEIAFGKIK